MDQVALERWKDLHRAFCLGEPLSLEQQEEYDAGGRELDDEEMAEIEVAGLQEELARFQALERQNERLEAERRRLNAQIAALESSLGDGTRRKLRVEV